MRLLIIILLFFSQQSFAHKNLILVTIDGLRWQEVFRGADEKLVTNKNFVKQPQQLAKDYWHADKHQRRQKLMPFFWQTIVNQGVVIGNRDIGSNMSVANGWHFSYPGYSEIFTGIADNNINSNDKILNPHVSFIEWLNKKQNYDKAAVFGSWDVFPFIFNYKRSDLHINAGFTSAHAYPFSEEVTLLNRLQKEIPSPWHNVRLDSFTYRFAKDYLLVNKPKVMAIAFGETDDFAHDGHYDKYLRAVARTDEFIHDLWRTIQSTPGYANNTTLLITTDHGRGATEIDWQHHASAQAIESYMNSLKTFNNGIDGSEHIWFAALGAGIKAQGQIIPEHEIKQNQIAATAISLLKHNPKAFNHNAGSYIKEIF